MALCHTYLNVCPAVVVKVLRSNITNTTMKIYFVTSKNVCISTPAVVKLHQLNVKLMELVINLWDCVMINGEGKKINSLTLFCNCYQTI